MVRVRVKVKVRFRVNLLQLHRFNQAYNCTLVVLLRHRWHMNKFSNFKIHRHIYSHCLFRMTHYVI